ncbi:MAG: hypothetical protein Q3972_06095 [Corynebacterium sp.]|nr:hypothetical protein [Corynebacterium sp.]
MEKFVPSQERKTAPMLATGLVGGWLIARETGIRPIGGVLLAAMGGLSLETWFKKSGPIAALVLLATYIGGFIGSHRLAKKIGAWPSVLTVTGISALAAHFLNDRR